MTGKQTVKVNMSNELHDARNLLVRLKSIYKITLSEQTDLSKDFDEAIEKLKMIIEQKEKL